MIKKILIANRGEIAVRVINACRELGIQSVAVYSEVDHNALHVLMADEAYEIGPANAAASYLNIDRMIDIARKTGVDAIHPGYGFLAENPLFVERCEQEDLIFIGPGSKAMMLVGDKIRSRVTVAKAGVPVIPGMTQPLVSVEDLMKNADQLGYPVLLKASAGGGGKGMRIVQKKADLAAALESAKREAMAAFGDDSVYLEKYMSSPRHVEIQILADQHGHMVYLGERECSIQRRHQKIIEESPSTALTPELRAQMGETALKVVQATGYTNAGTVEFLIDRNNDFYFLEVNARLQVEHPVTEMVSGIDLVKQQIRIASGELLDLKQNEIVSRGHAIECRIYAEDPEQNFLPSTGRIVYLQQPSGPWVRNDSSLFPGLDISIHYDPILAKLIVWGETRDDAIARLIAAIDDYVILGVKHQLPFLKDVVNHKDFREGRTSTDFIESHYHDWKPVHGLKKIAVAAAVIQEMNAEHDFPQRQRQRDLYNPWTQLGYWELV
ncbi:acetyl-CoA carboxylase biotin carboxylase subunit [candidate division KSB1 bacterium]|nr:acetyl-CoA carboxylase biotin carboxylase subunit [candidate division KSB1 bacterium]